MDVKLTLDQENAVKLIAEWFFNTDDQVFVLAGYAGTGKTFLIDYLVREVLRLTPGEEVVFTSPTGKAAVNIIQKGTLAGTVHGLIYIRNEDDFEVDENGEIVNPNKLSFYKREKIDERIKLVIVDEASMINEEMLNDLLSFGVKCLFTGDSAQLPPVNGICRLLKNPHYELKEIVRQAKDNPIVRLATMAREGKRIPYGNYGASVCVMPRGALSSLERKKVFLRANQVICGRNVTRNSLNREIREYMGIPLEQKLPTEGEKLICTLNDWEKSLDKEEKFHLVNGVIGYVESVEEHLDDLGVIKFRADFLSESITVPFDTGIFLKKEYTHFYGDKAVTFTDGTVAHENNFALLHRLKVKSEEPIARFEFAYAITCHKAQGSEFDFAVIFDESWAFGEERNRWLYTAITRAKTKLLILR